MDILKDIANILKKHEDDSHLLEIKIASDREYKEKFKDNDNGINYHEIILIKDIMEYLDLHRTEITEICNLYDWDGITIYLDDDPEKNFAHNYMIPIYYDIVDNIIYIFENRKKVK